MGEAYEACEQDAFFRLEVLDLAMHGVDLVACRLFAPGVVFRPAFPGGVAELGQQHVAGAVAIGEALSSGWLWMGQSLMLKTRTRPLR